MPGLPCEPQLNQVGELEHQHVRVLLVDRIDTIRLTLDNLNVSWAVEQRTSVGCC